MEIRGRSSHVAATDFPARLAGLRATIRVCYVRFVILGRGSLNKASTQAEPQGDRRTPKHLIEYTVEQVKWASFRGGMQSR